MVKRDDLQNNFNSIPASNLLQERANESISPRRLDFRLLCLDLDLVGLCWQPPHQALVHQPFRLLTPNNSSKDPPGGARQLSRTHTAPHIGVSRTHGARVSTYAAPHRLTGAGGGRDFFQPPRVTTHPPLLPQPCFHPWQTGTTRVQSTHSWSQPSRISPMPSIGALSRVKRWEPQLCKSRILRTQNQLEWEVDLLPYNLKSPQNFYLPQTRSDIIKSCLTRNHTYLILHIGNEAPGGEGGQTFSHFCTLPFPSL